MLRGFVAALLLLLPAACAQTEQRSGPPAPVADAKPRGVDPSCDDGTDNPCRAQVVRQRGSRDVTIIVPGVNATGHAGF